MSDCVFCDIVAGKVPAFRVPTLDPWKTAAFIPLRPAVFGHLLVVPRTHAESLWDVSDIELWATVMEVRRFAELASEQFGTTGVNVVVNNGPDAHQTIPHVHFHVLPRKAGDELGPLPLSAEMSSARYYDVAREQMARTWIKETVRS